MPLSYATTWRQTFELYKNTDRESAEIRGRHLHALLRMTPMLMAANALCGVLVGWVLRAQQGWAVGCWFAILAMIVLAGVASAWRARKRSTFVASIRTFRHNTRHAAVLGILWGLVPALWFSVLPAGEQIVVACLMAGMLGAGAFALGVLPAASLAYAASILVGSEVALFRADRTEDHVLAALLLIYGVVVVCGSLAHGRRATALLRSKFEQDRQGHLVSLLLRDFEDNAHDVLWDIDHEGRFGHVSQRLADHFGMPVDELANVDVVDWLRRHSPAAEPLTRALERGRPFRDLRLPVQPDGTLRWWSISAKPLTDGEHRMTGWRGVFSDVTDQVRADERLHELAHHDALTGLVNRVTLHDAAQRALDSGENGALLSIDLDHFKVINDTLGHSCGDSVLRIVATRLKSIVRPSDMVSRLGGDEFALLLANPVGEREVRALAQRVIEVLSMPIDVDGRTLRVGASVGTVLLHDGISDIEQLMINADLALYDAKAAGRGRCSRYNPELGKRARRASAMEQALRQGVGQLALHFQPKVELRNWKVTGVEALMRWRHPELGAVSPAEFIQAAERCGQIRELGDWAVHRACAAARELPGLTVAVNVSPLQLQDRDFADRAAAALAEYRLGPDRIEIEVTESVLLDDAEGALEQLRRLRELGFRIALDDFGTGYSSLAYLRRFPFDELKIDRTFVHELTSRADARAIVNTIVQLAGELGMSTVAEGLETAQQLEAISASGCTAVQGYLISRPLPLDQLKALLADWSPRPLLSLVH